ncbi:MAG: hypothetical protein ACRDDX_06230 [Cellulosilyticaceae bacterium]
MNMKRKYTGILLLVAMLVTGCSNNYMTSIYNSDDKISSSTNSYNLDGVTQTIEGEKFIGEVEKLEGMDTIWSYEATEDMELEITYLLNAIKGRVKLVLISPDGSLTNVIERSDNATFTDYATSTIQLKKGTNRLKMVGDKECSIKFEITIPCGEFKQLGM